MLKTFLGHEKFLLIVCLLIQTQLTFQSDIDISSLSNVDQIKQKHIDFNIEINFDKQMYLFH